MGIGIAVVMSQSPAVVARTNAVRIVGPIAEVTGTYEACQSGELLPAGTSAIRLSLEAMFGPSVRVRVLQDDQTLTSGTQASGWSRQSVTVHVKPLPRAVAGVSVCFAIAPKDELVYVKGSTVASTAASPEGRLFRIEYLRPGDRSWWALVPSVARRMSFGRATGGVWIILAVVAAMVALTAIVSLVVVRNPP
jgi:hypothetical protein